MGIKRIYSDKKGILEIFNDTYGDFQVERNKIKNLISYYTGEQDSFIPDSERKFNIKTVANYTKVFIDTVVAITLNKALSYICRKDGDLYKEDLDKIIDYLNDEGEHEYNLSTCNDLMVTGIGYQYCLEQKVNDPTPYSPFTIGVFSPDSTYCVQSYDIGNKVIASFHISSINGQTVVTAFDDKYRYKIVNNELVPVIAGDDRLRIEHGLPYNPIQMFESDKYRLSVVDDLMGLQNSLNIGLSNYNNSVLLIVNQLLTIIGADINEEDIKDNLKNNILVLPENGDAKFISAGINENVIDFIDSTVERMCIISGCPSQKSSNAETGVGVETENGHTIANFTSNKREQCFYKPKRQQLENIITILRRNGLLKSDISAKDIEIKFDRNRLMSITEHVNNLRTLLIDCKVGAYNALKVCDIFDDNASVAKEIEENFDREVAKTQA